MENLTNEELVSKLNEIFFELRERGVLRSNNFVGDLGEYLIMSHYNRVNPELGFTLTPPNQQSYDALDSQGNRYSIKTTRSGETSCIRGIDRDARFEDVESIFDYLVIAELDAEYRLIRIIKMSWIDFFQYRSWHRTMNAYKITLNNFLRNTFAVYPV